jgi:hypothetical protein
LAADGRRGHRGTGDRVLVLALAGLAVVLALTLVAAWLSVRQPPMAPVAVPSVARI